MNRRRIVLMALAGALLVQGSCQQGSPNRPLTGEMNEYSGPGFTLSYPQTIGITKERPVDFDIYRFLCEGRTILWAYVGNHPDFTYDSRAVISKSKGVINGLLCARARIQNGNEPVQTHILIKFPTDRSWPAYIHFWYADLPPDFQKVAENIIASVQAQTKGAYPPPPGVIISDEGEFPPQTPTVELVEKHIQETKELLKATQEAGKPVDPNVVARIQQLEQMLMTIKSLSEEGTSQPPN